MEQVIKEKAKEDIAGRVSISLGEYLEDYSDADTWDVQGLCKWAMSAFRVNLSSSKVKQLSPEQIEEQLVSAAAEQVAKKDCSQLQEFVKQDFAVRRLAEWADAKFDINVQLEKLQDSQIGQVEKYLKQMVSNKYRQREIEYPVEFAMSMVYGAEGTNVYGFESLAQWAKRKYNAELSAEKIQNSSPRSIRDELFKLSETYNNGKLDTEVEQKVSELPPRELAGWANRRFDFSLDEGQLSEKEGAEKLLKSRAKEFLRQELAELEKYVLLQIYDSVWKDHLYAMDHLKESIWTRSFAERDPKVEYKREGFRMFNEMLGTIEERVTDTIFKVRLDVGTKARSIWNVSETAHDQLGRFEMTERQRAAAQAP